MDDVASAFILCGTEAVLELRDHYKDETRIPEPELNRCMAKRLKAMHGSWDIRSDPFSYTRLLTILGHDATSRAIVQVFGGLSADVGVLRNGHDPVLLENKITDEWRKFDRDDGVLDDRDRKLRPIAATARVDGYVGVHVCQDGPTSVRETLKQIEAGLGVPLIIGNIQKSKDGTGWEWVFVCAKVTDRHESDWIASPLQSSCLAPLSS